MSHNGRRYHPCWKAPAGSVTAARVCCSFSLFSLVSICPLWCLQREHSMDLLSAATKPSSSPPAADSQHCQPPAVRPLSLLQRDEAPPGGPHCRSSTAIYCCFYHCQRHHQQQQQQRSGAACTATHHPSRWEQDSRNSSSTDSSCEGCPCCRSPCEHSSPRHSDCAGPGVDVQEERTTLQAVIAAAVQDTPAETRGLQQAPSCSRHTYRELSPPVQPHQRGTGSPSAERMNPWLPLILQSADHAAEELGHFSGARCRLDKE